MNRKVKIIVSFVIIFLVIVSICFLWKEPLSLEKKVNDQKLTNFILIFTSTVAAVSFLLLWKQLEEQRLSRLNSVLPDVLPQDLVCIIEECGHEIGGSKGIHIYPGHTGPSIVSLINIGVGSAKEIKTQWLYDILEVNDLIKDKYSYFTPIQRGDSDSISFLKPNEKGEISLPLYYILCCGAKLNLKSIHSGSDGKFGIKPQLKLQVSYLDLNNRKFEEQFEANVVAYSEHLFFKFTQSPR